MPTIATTNEKAEWLRSSIKAKRSMLQQYQDEIGKYENVITDLQRDLDNLRGVAREIQTGISRSESLLRSYKKGNTK